MVSPYGIGSQDEVRVGKDEVDIIPMRIISVYLPGII